MEGLMKKFNYSLVLFSFILLFSVATGCSFSDPEKTDESKTIASSEKETKKQNNTEPAIPNAADTFIGMMTQEQGILMKEITEKDLDGKTGWDAQPYMNYYNDTFKKSSETAISKYIKEHKAITDKDLYNYLVYTVGSGEYQKYYESLNQYAPDFKAPDLPEDTAKKETKQRQNTKTNVIVLLDASGSMNGTVPGGKKIDLAKSSILSFVSSLPKDTNASLLVYGHEGTGSDEDKAKSCGKIDTLYPLKPYNQAQFQSAMNKFNASGWTPLSQAISKARDILTNYSSKEYTNKIYIVSDGIETCDGNPVKAAQSLQDSNIQATVNIIGFDVDDDGVRQLKQVAEAGKGEFIQVSDKTELEAQIQNKWTPSIIEMNGKQAVNALDMVEAQKDITNLVNSLNSLSNNEKTRIEGIIQTLYNQKLISDTTKNTLFTKAADMHTIRHKGIEQLKEQKFQELKDIEKTYQQQINEWKDQF